MKVRINGIGSMKLFEPSIHPPLYLGSPSSSSPRHIDLPGDHRQVAEATLETLLPQAESRGGGGMTKNFDSRTGRGSDQHLILRINCGLQDSCQRSELGHSGIQPGWLDPTRYNPLVAKRGQPSLDSFSRTQQTSHCSPQHVVVSYFELYSNLQHNSLTDGLLSSPSTLTS